MLSRCRSGLGSDPCLTPVPFLPQYVKGLSVHVSIFNFLWPQVMFRNDYSDVKGGGGFVGSEDVLKLESHTYP